MLEYGFTPEQIRTGLESIAWIIPIFAMAFTQRQKDWLKERDGNTCQVKGFKGIRCSRDLEEDHIIPQRYAREVLQMSEEEIDSALNGITICSNHHRGHPNSKHPDAHVALYNYQENKNSFAEMFAERDAALQQGEVYWNRDYDEIESAIALRNTKRFTKNWTTNEFPNHNHRNNGRTY